jgi:hypothetical protein
MQVSAATSIRFFMMVIASVDGAFQLRASFLGMCRTKELGDVWIVPARALPNQGEPNIWRSFSPPPFCPAVGEKSDRMTKKLAGIPEFGFNPNQCPSRWSTPKFWLGSYGQQSKQTRSLPG